MFFHGKGVPCTGFWTRLADLTAGSIFSDFIRVYQEERRVPKLWGQPKQ